MEPTSLTSPAAAGGFVTTGAAWAIFWEDYCFLKKPNTFPSLWVLTEISIKLCVIGFKLIELALTSQAWRHYFHTDNKTLSLSTVFLLRILSFSATGVQKINSREVGGGFRMGNMCIPVADSC